jgi:hypothetical protein
MIGAMTTSVVLGGNKSVKNYTSKEIHVEGIYLKNGDKGKQYRKIIKSYNDLKKTKNYVKNNFNSPKKYIKELNKYNKKFFKKNALIFVTDNVDVNHSTYNLSSVEKGTDRLIVNVNKNITLEPGMSTTTVVKYRTDSYLISVKKSKIKKIKKVKIVYN